jgi:polysaccharide pyruvyl transferase WcaK-like protein
LEPNFVYNIPTHLSAFNAYSVWRNSYTVQKYSQCDLKFIGGTNLLVKNLMTHYPQWNIHLFDCNPLKGAIGVGVGAGRDEKTNKYTTRLYRKVLSDRFYHSVRDNRSKEYVESLGLRAVNTGCVTMWMLTPEFCKTIPKEKSNQVVFTLTGRSKNMPVISEDQKMIEILLKNYKKVFFWIQGELDEDYLKQFKGSEQVEIVPPSLEAYDALLREEDLDYVGTRLHGGIYAMRHRKRSIIIAIDERAREINMANNLNCIDRSMISDCLEDMILSSFETKITMPFDEIARWKAQFCL